MSEELNKSESNKDTVKRPLTGEVGQPHIVKSSRFVQDLRKKDLEMPRRFCTYENMMYDDAVANSVDVTNIQVVSSLSKGEFVSTGSSVSQKAADFLNYCIRNLRYGTWLEAMNDAATDLTYGFSFSNLVVRKAKNGPYSGAFILDKISPRKQDSLYGWVWNKNNTELKGFVQKPLIEKLREPKVGRYKNSIPYDLINGNSYGDTKYPFISTDQMLLFRHNPTNNNPQGNSPLNACYDAWTEKKLVEHYEVVGVSKDFGGLVIVRVPSELIEQANDPAKYPDAADEYIQLQEDASNLQQGKSTHIVLTSDTDEISKQYLYDLELKGIDGSGKQYKTEEIVNQKRKSIYNVFGTGFLLLGQNGHGSNALAGSQMTTHDYFIERCVDWKVDVIMHQLAPRLLAVNGIYLNHKDMPVFKPADPSKPDWDTISKVLQRAGSVELLTNKAIEDLYTSAGWDIEGLDEHLTKREEMKKETRAGESMGSSGTGDTQSGGASSTTNMENKSFIVDYETDEQIIAVDSKTGEPIFINKKE